MTPIVVLKLISVRAAVLALAFALVVTGLAPAAPAPASKPAGIKTRATETVHAVDASGHEFALPEGTTHVAIHWPGHPDARVEAAFSSDGDEFEAAVHVEIDEVGAERGNGETYGTVVSADDMRVVRVTADEPLDGVTVLAMDAGGDELAAPLGMGGQAAGLTSIPGVIPRSGWGADETIRFDSRGEVRWGQAYFPLQKLIVHHTAGSNSDPDPAATMRAIYHYHAVTQDWGDIGYNYLIDRWGRIYEGRHSGLYWNGTIPTSDNGTGLTIAGGHALEHNSGTMGIALLGTFDAVAPTAAAQSSLVSLLAWAASVNGLSPTGSSTYVNPVTGLTRYVPNIAGHRSYNSTGCPGAVLNSLLPSIRSSVAAAMNAWPGELYNPNRTLSLAAGTHVGYRFNAAGGITGSKPFSLGAPSSAPTSQRATVPGQAGFWYLVTAGVWAGYWIQESGRTAVSPGPPDQAAESYLPFQMLNFAAGTYVGRRFNTYGTVIASKSYTLAAGSTAPTTEKSTIPNQAGNWYYVTAGVWDGYWIQETAGTVLTDPPAAPLPPVVVNFDPAKTLSFAAGTYIGRQFDGFGNIIASKSYTLASASSAPTDQQMTMSTRPGTWYRVTAGVWAGYWIEAGPGVWLTDPPAAPPPPVVVNFDPAKTLSFAAGTYIGRQFDGFGNIIASKSYTLASASSAPTDQQMTMSTRPGTWYRVTAGVWAGYWIEAGPGVWLTDPPAAPPPPVVVNFDPAKTLSFAAGTYIGRQFDGFGNIIASKSYTLASASSAPTDQQMTMSTRPGTWYRVTAGVWAGYWIEAGPGVWLTDPPAAPPPPVVVNFDPAKTLSFAAGTYIGRQFDGFGNIIASKSYTLASASSAPTDQQMTMSTRPGTWYRVTAGVWAGYWIEAGPGVSLSP